MIREKGYALGFRHLPCLLIIQVEPKGGMLVGSGDSHWNNFFPASLFLKKGSITFSKKALAPALRLAFRKPFGVFEIPSVYEGFHEGGKTSSAPLKSRVPYRCPEAESNRHARIHLKFPAPLP